MKKIFISIVLFGLVNLFGFEQLNTLNFEDKIKGKNVIVDFYATWCPPCHIMSKILLDYGKVKPQNITVYKVDIDQDRELAMKYGVQALPTLAYFENGTLITTEVGIKSIEDLKNSTSEYFE